MEPSKEAIAVRITRLNRQILGKVTSGSTKISKRNIDREALFDALTALYDECNDDPVKRTDDLVKVFVDKYRSTLAELRRARVCISDFEILQTIGRGYFGEVHMVREKQTSDVYALKTVKKELARRRVTGAEDERDVLASATNQWMPRLQYAFQDANNLYLVMELCSGGDLAGLLARRNHPLSERDAAFYVCEVAHALKALHAMGYVHRDIKPNNILLDRCGHVKLGDFGSCSRLSDGSQQGPAVGATPDYVAPELLAAAHCANTHAVCSHFCRDIVTHAISACDYWSLGVVAFELVTLRRPFSNDEEDSMAQILSNIQKYESSADPQPPFPDLPEGPSPAWRELVGGLLRVSPAKRYTYLDTLQHPAMGHISVHSIRDQPPPWVPLVRGAEDASFLPAPERSAPPPCAAPFRTRPPFAGQLPFVGYSYVAPEENEDSSGGFSTSHDCTAIDLATFKSAEKLAAMRSREITSLQNRLAAAEASAGAAAERARRDADAEAERHRAKLQAEITALSLQNKRLERQIEVEKEERMALQRTNQELTMGVAERTGLEARNARADAERAALERDAARGDLARLEDRVAELQGELARAVAAADSQRLQHQHYKDSVAKERAIRRQTLSGGEQEARDVAARLANAEASLAREARARDLAEKRVNALDEDYEKALAQNKSLQAEMEDARRQISCSQDIIDHKQRELEASKQELHEVQTQLAQEKLRNTTVLAQVQELERGLESAARREAALEEQSARTEARLHERLAAADARAATAASDDARHREKVNTLEQLVRQLEREVSALETRVCPRCTNNLQDNQTKDVKDTNGADDAQHADNNRRDIEKNRQDIKNIREDLESKKQDLECNRQAAEMNRQDTYSDTESSADLHANVDAINAQVALLKEQLEKAEAQLQSRAEESATLRQEARAANLARWRKEREYNELSLEAKSSAREVKRLEERLSSAIDARKKAERQATALQTEMTTLKPQYERVSKDLEQLKEELQRLRKTYETAQAEVDRSRNDIRKLKSELQYSEKRRLHAEQQEEMSSRERALLRDEAHSLRNDNNQLVQNNKALQEACSVLEEQLSDLENLADIHELKNKDLEGEVHRLRSELESCRSKLEGALRQASEASAAAARLGALHEDAREQADRAQGQITLLQEKLECREARVSELEAQVAGAEGEAAGSAAALSAAGRRLRDLQEECAATRTRAHHHHALALQAQAALADAQEELSAAREAADAANAWWRTRETKSEATLRQQAKLIDFLQAKLEEAARKKGSLNKLFGRATRRNNASPPLRRANRELREEVDRLRAKLAASNSSIDLNSLPPTPRREKTKPVNNVIKSIDTPDCAQDDTVLIVWPDDSRERMRAICRDGAMVLKSGDRELNARLYSADAKNLPQNEANRAFTVKVENCIRGGTAAVVCHNLPERSSWLSRLQAVVPPVTGYSPSRLAELQPMPLVALYVAPDATAIGCVDGLHSLRGAIRLEWNGDVSPPRRVGSEGVTSAASAGQRALLVCGGTLVAAGLMALASTLRRAHSLRPSLEVTRVRLPDATPHLVKGSVGDVGEGPCAAVACGRRVFLLRFDGATSEFKIARSLTVDRAPDSLLLTSRALFIAGEKPLKIGLPSGALEAFATDEPTVAAAARKRSPPRAILLIRERPLEMLLCYAECGVFVDEFGRRTRTDDPKWGAAVRSWEFVSPFLYVVGDDRITIVHVNEDAYRSPPCTCADSASLHSGGSECASPETFELKAREPQLLGATPAGVIVRTLDDDCYNVSIVEGMAAFRSVGASVESLETVSDARGSSTDLADSLTELRDAPRDDPDRSRVSQESVEATTDFLANIRKRARQLRDKNRQERSDEMIKQILTAEVGPRRSSMGRKSPATTSEFDSDSTGSEERTESKGTSEICAEMFTRQVRFQ